jgi:hypothetical protein
MPRIYFNQGEIITKEWRNPNNEEIDKCSSSPNLRVIWVIKLRTIIRRTFLEDIWGGARRGLLRSSSLSQDSGVVQLALRGT